MITKTKKNKNIITHREEQILLMVNNDMKYYEVANKLSISIETVRRHASNCYKKLQAPNKTQALFTYYSLTK